MGVTAPIACRNSPIFRAKHKAALITPTSYQTYRKSYAYNLLYSEKNENHRLVLDPGRGPPHAPPPCWNVIGHLNEAQHWCNRLLSVPLADTAVMQGVPSNGDSLLGWVWPGHVLFYVRKWWVFLRFSHASKQFSQSQTGAPSVFHQSYSGAPRMRLKVVFLVYSLVK